MNLNSKHEQMNRHVIAVSDCIFCTSMCTVDSSTYCTYTYTGKRSLFLCGADKYQTFYVKKEFTYDSKLSVMYTSAVSKVSRSYITSYSLTPGVRIMGLRPFVVFLTVSGIIYTYIHKF